jgi:hypothetical protein
LHSANVLAKDLPNIDQASAMDEQYTLTQLLKLTEHMPPNYALVNALTNFTDDLGVIAYLYRVAEDHQLEPEARIRAIDLLSYTELGSATDCLLRIATNERDALLIRTRAVEQLADCFKSHAMPVLITLLQHAQVELRFWAAFVMVRLSSARQLPKEVIPLIDTIVATDDTVPSDYWYVGREAFPALSNFGIGGTCRRI